jgi:NAD+ kinase
MILPISSNLLALTPISPFRPRRWRGALLPKKAKVKFEVLKPEKRPVKAVADNFEVDDVICVEIELDESKTIHLLFDSGQSLEERIMREMFEIC